MEVMGMIEGGIGRLLPRLQAGETGLRVRCLRRFEAAEVVDDAAVITEPPDDESHSLGLRRDKPLIDIEPRVGVTRGFEDASLRKVKDQLGPPPSSIPRARPVGLLQGEEELRSVAADAIHVNAAESLDHVGPFLM